MRTVKSGVKNSRTCLHVFGVYAGRSAGICQVKERVSLLEELRHVLKILEGELEYAHASLPEAFLKAGESRDPYGLFFSGMAEEMGTYPGKGRSEIFREQTAAVFSGTALKKEDVRILEELGNALGRRMSTASFRCCSWQKSGQNFRRKKHRKNTGRKGKWPDILASAWGCFLWYCFFRRIVLGRERKMAWA